MTSLRERVVAFLDGNKEADALALLKSQTRPALKNALKQSLLRKNYSVVDLMVGNMDDLDLNKKEALLSVCSCALNVNDFKFLDKMDILSKPGCSFRNFSDPRPDEFETLIRDAIRAKRYEAAEALWDKMGDARAFTKQTLMTDTLFLGNHRLFKKIAEACTLEETKIAVRHYIVGGGCENLQDISDYFNAQTLLEDMYLQISPSWLNGKHKVIHDGALVSAMVDPSRIYERNIRTMDQLASLLHDDQLPGQLGNLFQAVGLEYCPLWKVRADKKALQEATGLSCDNHSRKVGPGKVF